jgi:hypothetical protein
MLSSRSTLWVVLSAFSSACRGDAGTTDADRTGGEDAAKSAAEADAAIREAMADSGSWPSYGRDYSNSRYSPLRQITPANVARLDLAWKYDTRIPEAFETIDSLIMTGLPEPMTRTPIAMPARGAKSDLSAEESRLIAAYVWAISQTRGEPWPGGHVSHRPDTAQAARPTQ